MATSAFRALAERTCPAFDDCLLALGVEFGEDDPAPMLDRLDDDARGLFGLVAAPAREQRSGVAEALGDVAIADGAAACVFATVAAQRRGAPMLLCVLAHELARRAGLGFVVGTTDDLRWVVVDPAEPGVALTPGAAGGFVELEAQAVRCRCAHEVAFALLGDMVSGFVTRGCPRAALHASELRLALPVTPQLRERLERQHEHLRRHLGLRSE